MLLPIFVWLLKDPKQFLAVKSEASQRSVELKSSKMHQNGSKKHFRYISVFCVEIKNRLEEQNINSQLNSCIFFYV